MFLEKYVKDNNVYVKLSENTKYIKDGKTKYKKRTVLSLGNEKKLPVSFQELRESYKNGVALIPELEKFLPGEVKISLNINDSTQYIEKNVGYLLLNRMFDQLGISNVITLEKSRKNIKYDILGLTKLLVFERFLNPCSKYRTFTKKDMFLGDVTKSSDYREIYAALDVLDNKAPQIMNIMNRNIERTITRDKSLIFYDVTNYYFETDRNDEDGIRKAGVSKENRKQPVVQMGLFLDRNSIPIAYDLHPGNTLDSLTLKPSMQKYIDRYDLENILIVADRGLCSGGNEIYIKEQGNDYLFARSVRKASKEMKEWILDQEDYVTNESGSFKYKYRLLKRIATADGGKTRKEIEEKVLVYWSKSFYERELKEKERFIETLRKYSENPNSIPSRKAKGLEKYIKREQVDKKTGEILKTREQRSIDLEKIEKEDEMMGYYLLSTSKTEMNPSDMINTYKGLTKIENCFRITKSELEARPVFVRKKEHINAHFLICFISLVMMRIIQYKLFQKEEKEFRVWSEGLSARKIQESLKEFKVAVLDDRCIFREMNEDLQLLLDRLEIPFDFKVCKVHEISRKLKFSL